MIERICQVCGSGYNRSIKRCRKCGNERMAKVVTAKYGSCFYDLKGKLRGDKIFRFEIVPERLNIK